SSPRGLAALAAGHCSTHFWCSPRIDIPPRVSDIPLGVSASALYGHPIHPLARHIPSSAPLIGGADAGKWRRSESPRLRRPRVERMTDVRANLEALRAEAAARAETAASALAD